MIAAIKLCLQMVPVANKRSKVHDMIKRSVLENPLVDPLPSLLPRRVRVRLPATRKRRDRRTDGHQARFLTVGDNLLVRADQAVAEPLLGRGVRRAGPDVVYAFEDEDVLHPLLGEGVAAVAL